MHDPMKKITKMRHKKPNVAFISIIEEFYSEITFDRLNVIRNFHHDIEEFRKR